LSTENKPPADSLSNGWGNHITFVGRQTAANTAPAELPKLHEKVVDLHPDSAGRRLRSLSSFTLKDIHVTGFQTDLLSLENTSGTGLDQSNH
jgi:hypothetical protein